MSEEMEKATESKGATKAAPKSKVVTEEAIRRGVENWVSTHLRNTSFSRNMEAWNTLQKALPELPGAIAKEVE